MPILPLKKLHLVKFGSTATGVIFIMPLCATKMALGTYLSRLNDATEIHRLTSLEKRINDEGYNLPLT